MELAAAALGAGAAAAPRPRRAALRVATPEEAAGAAGRSKRRDSSEPEGAAAAAAEPAEEPAEEPAAEPAEEPAEEPATAPGAAAAAAPAPGEAAAPAMDRRRIGPVAAAEKIGAAADDEAADDDVTPPRLRLRLAPRLRLRLPPRLRLRLRLPPPLAPAPAPLASPPTAEAVSAAPGHSRRASAAATVAAGSAPLKIGSSAAATLLAACPFATNREKCCWNSSLQETGRAKQQGNRRGCKEWLRQRQANLTGLVAKGVGRRLPMASARDSERECIAVAADDDQGTRHRAGQMCGVFIRRSHGGTPARQMPRKKWGHARTSLSCCYF
jgi:hypothetical protein